MSLLHCGISTLLLSALGQSRHGDPGRRSVYVRYTSKSGRKPEPIVTNRPQGRVTPWVTAVRSPCDWEERAGGGPCGWLGTYCPGTGGQRRAYVFGEVRVATLALLTFTTLSGRRSSGVVTAKFSGHAATFRSSPTVCADTPRFLSASTRILSGKPPRAMWSAAVLLGLYRIMASLAATANCPMSLQRLFTPSDGSKRCSDGQP